MPDYRYLIVGGGMTADAAARAIREADPEGTVGILADEPDAPYSRPPLSKGLWKGEALETIWRCTGALGVTIHQGVRAARLDPAAKRVTDDRGGSYGYDKLLLATGGRARRLAFAGDDVIHYRTLADYRRLRELADAGRRIVVVGGGFIGSEVAAALAVRQCPVEIVFPEHGIGARVFPPDLAHFLNDYYGAHGVVVRPGEVAFGLERSGGALVLKTASGAALAADAVVAGISIQPNVELAAEAGLKTDNGILVDHRLRAGPDIWAAGDVANVHSRTFGKRTRVEHEDNALQMGRYAGVAMVTGTEEPYSHVPFFYSDLFDLGYEAVGETDPRLEVVADWREPFRQGVVYYVDHGKVRGVLLWNTWGQVDAARRLIAEPGPFRAKDLRGRLPE